MPPAPLFDAADDAASPVLAGPSGGSVGSARTAEIDRTIALLEKARASCSLPVMTMDVPIYSSRSYLAKIVARPSRGDMVVVLDVSGDWLKVRAPSGRTGWTRREQLVVAPPATVCSTPGTGGHRVLDDGGGAGRG